MYQKKALSLSLKEQELATDTFSILFVASEVEGLIKSGGLADVAKALPEALSKLDQNIRIALPAYGQITGIKQCKVLLDTRLDTWPHTQYKVRQTEVAGVMVYAVECPEYFDRQEMYAEQNQAYKDNGERFAFFSAACLDMLPKLDFLPNIIHANDWHTGLIPYLLKHRYHSMPFYSSIKTILSVHNAVFKGQFPFEEVQCIPEFHTRFAPEAQVSGSHISMLKAGVMCADKVNAVSPRYAEELKTDLGSHGMGEEFLSRAEDLVGILNGCDYSAWDPRHDPIIPVNYHGDLKSMLQGKKACKRALQQRVNLPEKDVAAYGMVCRLTHQKGVHYFMPVLKEFLRNNLQLVVVGTGDPVFAYQLEHIAEEFSDNFVFVNAYDNELAHLVEAGADFFIMPSEFEPCGLNQMYSMAYGTLPIVRSVGGLKDSVTDYDEDNTKATGFVFHKPEPEALLAKLQRTFLLYLQSPQEIQRTQCFAMQQDFCWNNAANEYLKLYQSTQN